MPVVGSSAYNTAGQITALVRSLLNDSQGNLFTDSLLLPYVNSAYRKMQRAIGNAGAGGFIQDDALLVVSAVAGVDTSLQVSITDATVPPNQLPTDLLFPLKIWERPNGSAQDFVEMVDLSQHGGLPSRRARCDAQRLGMACRRNLFPRRHARHADPPALPESVSGSHRRHVASAGAQCSRSDRLRRSRSCGMVARQPTRREVGRSRRGRNRRPGQCRRAPRTKHFAPPPAVFSTQRLYPILRRAARTCGSRLYLRAPARSQT